MKEGTSAQLSGRGELHGGARVTTLVTLRKCTLGNKREIKTLKFVSASTKGFKGGLAWIKPSKKDMAVTFSYYACSPLASTVHVHCVFLISHGLPFRKPLLATVLYSTLARTCHRRCNCQCACEGTQWTCSCTAAVHMGRVLKVWTFCCCLRRQGAHRIYLVVRWMGRKLHTKVWTSTDERQR